MVFRKVLSCEERNGKFTASNSSVLTVGEGKVGLTKIILPNWWKAIKRCWVKGKLCLLLAVCHLTHTASVLIVVCHLTHTTSILLAVCHLTHRASVLLAVCHLTHTTSILLAVCHLTHTTSHLAVNLLFPNSDLTDNAPHHVLLSLSSVATATKPVCSAAVHLLAAIRILLQFHLSTYSGQLYSFAIWGLFVI